MESKAITTTDQQEQQEQKEQQEQQVLAPMTPQAAREMMLMYQEYEKLLLDDSDYQLIGGKKFKKKSAWRKLAMANNLSVRIVDDRKEELPNGDYAYHFICEATHPNGRVTSGSGSYTAYEKATWREGKWMREEKQWNGKYMKTTGNWILADQNILHNIRSTAETRAWNRSVSNMIAAGEVSAEEVDQEHHNEQYVDVQPTKKQITSTATTQSTPVNQTQTTSEAEPLCPVCNGAMWDCRTREDGGKGTYPKTNPAAPDWRCKNKCKGGVIWPKKQQEEYDKYFHGGLDENDVPPITDDEIPF